MRVACNRSNSSRRMFEQCGEDKLKRCIARRGDVNRVLIGNVSSIVSKHSPSPSTQMSLRSGRLGVAQVFRQRHFAARVAVHPLGGAVHFTPGPVKSRSYADSGLIVKGHVAMIPADA